MLRRWALLLGLAAALATTPGCAGFQGARLYRSGSEALERGETSRAIGDLERAARLVPQASEVHNHLGLAYAQAGRDGEALGAFARAVELDCDNAAAAHNLELWREKTSESASPVAREQH